MPQIIPKKPVTVEPNWQKDLAQSFTDPLQLLQFLEIPTQAWLEAAKARKLFPLRVPRPFARRMQKGNPCDPLLLQVLTQTAEFQLAEGYSQDPLEEQDNQVPGLLHKYQSRVLLIVRGGCAVNCRYCFRRHFPYQDNSLNKSQWQQAFDYIAADDKIDEVIFSGGDPLMAKDSHLAWMAGQIGQIPHVKTLRIHTRLPVVIPSRISDEFVHWFAKGKFNPVMILHINHANEIDAELRAKLLALRSQGVTLLNQAVLLNKINDSAPAQIALNQALFAAGVMPYYLHMLDKVQGAAHFDVPDRRAREIMAEVIKRQPGYLVPKLVREIGGQPGKTPVDLHLHPS